MKIQEFFASYYDPATDKICNSTLNSFIYFHEEKHQKQYKNGIIQQCQMMIFLCMILAIFSVSLKASQLAIFFSSISIILFLYPEIDAWIYAFIKYFKVKHD